MSAGACIYPSRTKCLQYENKDHRKGCETLKNKYIPHRKSCLAIVRGNFVDVFVSADHVDPEAICIVSYPVYYHSYPAARISESMTSLGFSLESVVLALFPALRVGVASYSSSFSFLSGYLCPRFSFV